jgi:hypothetical protein
MAQILKFRQAADEDIRQKRRGHLRVVRNELPVEEPGVFWLEASKGLWSRQPVPINPANSAGHVLTEMAMVLGGSALLVLLTIAFIGTPYA